MVLTRKRMVDNICCLLYFRFPEGKYVKPVIAFALNGPPTCEGDLAVLDVSELQISQVYSDEIDRKVTTIYNCIKELGLYFNKMFI